MSSYALPRFATGRFRSRWPLALGLVLSAMLSLAALLAGPPADAGVPENRCPAGSFCVWPETGFGGQPRELALRTTGVERCVTLETTWEVKSFANNTGHPVTVYQDPHCDEEADFDTHPTGSLTPQAGYVARAIQVWSH
ncbi:peptidase inhibitor family I36 protein [Saccharopolyspora mangrovi]|uniref:Peptidase inhibitor family I36 protein n=1 Tax=Saccharopolyspora mangrovi TaxID=3082379 RepID=A0ABU6A470_9PSEU|nr:peptidase inhibitor family I36 protein [Saccharopolyspora sp. S2-29]MEB3366229.1 peptidase inhibitor family I36 protein [Saccharopolyspora sp. S2-29]